MRTRDELVVYFIFSERKLLSEFFVHCLENIIELLIAGYFCVYKTYVVLAPKIY